MTAYPKLPGAIVLVVLLCGSAAMGQTTQPAPGVPVIAGTPAPEAWDAAVRKFADALAHGAADEAKTLLTGSSGIRAFDPQKTAGLSDLIDFASNKRMLGRHAYLSPAASLAADLAADAAAAKSLPAGVKKQLSPESPIDQAHAAAVAAQWVDEALLTGPATPVGIIMFWNADPPGDPERRPPVFVLLRGEEISPGEFKMVTVVFGDPLEAHPARN